MEFSPEHQEARQRVADYAAEFSEIATRAERCRVNTRKGREIFDGGLREEYGRRNDRMDMLLESLFDAMPEEVKLELNKEEPPEGGSSDTPVSSSNITQVRFQLSTEPIPEGFVGDIYRIDLIDKQNDGRKF